MFFFPVLLALVTHAAQVTLASDRKSRSADPLCRNTCPDDWIKVFWDVLTLKDGRESVGRDDVDRLFYAMDVNADDRITIEEFCPFFKECSLICNRDVVTIFRIFSKEHLDGENFITADKLFCVFNSDGGDRISKDEFDGMWYQLLERLPNKGCPLTTSPPFQCPVFLG